MGDGRRHSFHLHYMSPWIWGNDCCSCKAHHVKLQLCYKHSLGREFFLFPQIKHDKEMGDMEVFTKYLSCASEHASEQSYFMEQTQLSETQSDNIPDFPITE